MQVEAASAGAEVRIAIENLEPATIPRLDDPAENASQWDQ
jgi:hypothetical protein